MAANGIHRFSVDTQRRERLESFLISSERMAEIHNQNEYWQRYRERIRIEVHEGQVLITGDPNMDSRLLGEHPTWLASVVSPQIWMKVLNFVRRIACHFQKFEDYLIKQRIYQKSFYVQELLKKYQSEFLPYGFWDTKRNPLLMEKFRNW